MGEILNELALFAGAGGGILGGKLLGWKTVCAVEINEYCRDRLMQRQNEGQLPPFPIWDDVRTFDGKPWRGLVDVISGGFPCQDISSQSSVYGNSDGLDGERSGLWSEFARLIGEIRPKHAFIENSPNLTFRGLDRIMCDLAALGHSARWGVVGANAAGLDHLRERIWIVTDNDGFRLEGRNNSNKERQGGAAFRPMEGLRQNKVRIDIPAPNAFGAANGLAGRVDRLKAVGNGQVPAVVKIVWRTLTNEKI